MGDNSKIAWTQATWNPVVGCSHVSPGCANCYAERMATRLAAMGQPRYVGLTRDGLWTGEVRIVPEVLDQPIRWKRPRHIFVNSMSDLFHESVPDAFIDQVFAVMALCQRHVFQCLTKRAPRMMEYMTKGSVDRVRALVQNAMHDQRARNVVGGPVRGGRTREGVEDRQATRSRSQKRGRVSSRGDDESMREGAGRMDRSVGILVGVGNAERKEAGDRGASNRLDIQQWSNTCRPHNQPSQREQGGQQAGESRVGDLFAAKGTRYQRAGSQTLGLSGGEPPKDETYGCGRGSYATSARVRHDSERDSSEIRDGPKGRVCDLPTTDMEAHITWPLPNVWLGVTAEDQQRADERVPLLLQTPAALRFVSVEPMLGPVDIGEYLKTIRWMNSESPMDGWLNWVIVGGESGSGARPCRLKWVRSVVEQCKAAGVPCFVKQLGARPVGYFQEGQEHEWIPSSRACSLPAEWPEDLRVREMPGVKT